MAENIKKTLVFLITCTLVMACSGPKEERSPSDEQKGETAEAAVAQDQRKTIVFFGNSITAGYQLDMDQAFPAIIQQWLDSLGYNYRVVNAGLSGETTASGRNRIEWVLRTVPDIFVLELGANDGLRGLPLEETPKNLQAIVDAVVNKNPDVKIIITGMEVPPNLGQEYTKDFRNIFPAIAEKNDAILIPFLLEGVAGDPELNLSDGIHPNPEGHILLAQTVWKYLLPLLEKREAL